MAVSTLASLLWDGQNVVSKHRPSGFGLDSLANFCQDSVGLDSVPCLPSWWPVSGSNTPHQDAAHI